MNKNMRYRILITIMLMTGARCLAADAGKPFSLEVKADGIKLVNGDMRVATVSGTIRFNIAGPFGNFGSDLPGSLASLSNISVTADTDSEKSVSLSHVGDEVVYTLTLTARSNSPAIELTFVKKNIAEQAIRRYFFLRLAGFKFPYYYDNEGWQFAGKPELPAADWMFLPSANTNGGYGLIPLNRKNIKITTLFPRDDWREVGPYFSPQGPYMIEPGDAAMVGFKIFPATSQWQVAAQARQELE